MNSGAGHALPPSDGRIKMTRLHSCVPLPQIAEQGPHLPSENEDTLQSSVQYNTGNFPIKNLREIVVADL